ncbi:NAD(P)H-dependent oxidoreductase [bacterium]|nr:NAD(P)H-dependent oxidoreductase [bacterium]
MTKKVLVILAHPHLNQSVANRQIAEVLKNTPDVTIHNLYDNYPYFHIDIKKEQTLLKQHDIIIFQHPFFWYNMPPLLKLWMDEVLTMGFAYGSKGEHLKNKKFMLAITTGSEQMAYSENGYHGFDIHNFLFAYKQTCQLCQMQWQEPHILFGSRKTTEEEIRNHAEKIKKHIITLTEAR